MFNQKGIDGIFQNINSTALMCILGRKDVQMFKEFIFVFADNELIEKVSVHSHIRRILCTLHPECTFPAPEA